MACIIPSPVLNNKWVKFAANKSITTPILDDLDLQSKSVFCIGSCFAEEVRLALQKQNIKVLPDFRGISADPELARFDELPERHHMNYYNVLSIERELKRAHNYGQPRDIETDFWRLDNLTYKSGWKIAKKSHSQTELSLYLDPFRRMCFSSDKDYFISTTELIDKAFAEAFQMSELFIITLGMSEVFLDKKNLEPLNQLPATAPNYPDHRTPLFTCLNEEKIFNSLCNIVELITNKDIPGSLLITVSPVPLNRTFRKNVDVVTANTFSKATNLAAVSKLLQCNYPNVYYYPSYEFISMPDQANYMKDFQHVDRAKVEHIMNSFTEATGL